MMKESIRGTKTERVLQDVKIGVCAVLCLLFLVLAILEAVSGIGKEVTVSEPISVSSALISQTQRQYTSSISGAIVNSADRPILADALKITVSDGRRERTVEAEIDLLLIPRVEHPIEYTWQSDSKFDRVKQVELISSGESTSLSMAASAGGAGAIFFFAALAALMGFFLVRTIKVRYYMWQESLL